MSTRPPEKRTQDVWDWLCADEVVAHALGAFQRARLDCLPRDQPFLANGTPYATRDDFLHAVLGHFTQSMVSHARNKRVPVASFYADAVDALANACPPITPPRLSTESTGRRASDPPVPLRPQRMSGAGVRAGEPVDSVGNNPADREPPEVVVCRSGRHQLAGGGL